MSFQRVIDLDKEGKAANVVVGPITMLEIYDTKTRVYCGDATLEQALAGFLGEITGEAGQFGLCSQIQDDGETYLTIIVEDMSVVERTVKRMGGVKL